MVQIRYTLEKSKDCKYCFKWDTKKNECEIGKENCYYILCNRGGFRGKKMCGGCAYGRVRPCVGYCLKKLMKEKI